MVDEEEAEALDRLLGSLQKKDEVQQRAEAITQLSVSAWHCTTCGIISERRKPQCQVRAPARTCVPLKDPMLVLGVQPDSEVLRGKRSGMIDAGTCWQARECNQALVDVQRLQKSLHHHRCQVPHQALPQPQVLLPTTGMARTCCHV